MSDVTQEDLLDVALFIIKKMDKSTRLDLILNLVPDKNKIKVLEALGYKERRG